MVSVIVLLLAAVLGASAQTLTTLVDFDGRNGANPYSSLIQATDGNFYGTTYGGGVHGDGLVFAITSRGSMSILHEFSGSDGSSPWAGLVQASDGNLYGTTYWGGTSGQGTVFKISPSGAFSTLHNFSGSDGSDSRAALVQGTDGNLYGTTYLGGAHDLGTIFKITPNGSFTVLYNFAGSDGAGPFAALVQGSDGNFYGTTSGGGHYGQGTVFRITSNGTLTRLYSFDGTHGAGPWGSLMQSVNGAFYGTTTLGGFYSGGTVFSITSSGGFYTVHSFGGSGEGTFPMAGLTQGSDGSFYGTTSLGGSSNEGVVYRITHDGRLALLHDFTSSDGAGPFGRLLQAANGSLYGTTEEGGAYNYGTVFSLSPVPAQFVPVTPCRLMDTRSPGNGGPIRGGTYESFNLPRLAQDLHCDSLASATAYSLNVTLVPQNGSPVGYLTIWPEYANQPGVSTMNSLDGRVKANAAIVQAGTGDAGGVNVYVSNTADVVLDINGYFAPASRSTLAFYPLAPCRVIDTRNRNGELGGPYLRGQVTRNFPIEDSVCVARIRNIQAYSFNVTVVPHPNRQALGYLTVWPQGQPQPNVSTLNNPTATDVANAAIVPAGTGGGISVFPSNDTDLVVDIDGYFAAPAPGGLALFPTVPCRALDTRRILGRGFVGEKTVNLAGSACAPPANAQAYVLNATVVPRGALGYLTLWPDGQEQPGVSTLNALDGVTTSNMAIVPTTNGSVDAFASNPTHLVLDISGYFAP